MVDAPPIPATPDAPAIAPPAPVSEAAAQTIHVEHAESWLTMLGHVATPENVEKLVTILTALAPLFARLP